MTHIFLVRDEEEEECSEGVIKERSNFCLRNKVSVWSRQWGRRLHNWTTQSATEPGAGFAFLSTSSDFSPRVDPDHESMRHESVNPFEANSLLLLLLFCFGTVLIDQPGHLWARLIMNVVKHPNEGQGWNTVVGYWFWPHGLKIGRVVWKV